MLSFFLAAFVHLALLGGVAGYGHTAASTAPAHGHMHIYDSAGGPPNT
jgi:hypothetical protein